MPDLSKLKICYLAGTLGQGGAERQLYYAVQGLRRAGASVRVLCLERGGFWEEPIRRLGVPVTWIGQSGSRLGRVLRICKDLMKDRPNVFQSQHFYTNAYVGVAGRLRNCPTVGALRSNGAFDVEGCGSMGGWLNLRLPGRLAANSRSSMTYALEHGVPAARLSLLPNVVDTEQFQPAGDPNGTLTLLAVGRLTREKRFDRFLTILHRLRHDHGLNVRGLIAGGTRPGEGVRSELERQAGALGLLAGGVQFLGGLSDLRQLYQQASVCLLTSDQEGTPNVLLEAMASGVPVVATNVGGVPDIVQHGQTGFVLPPEELSGLTTAVLQLLRQAGLRADMGMRGRAFVQQNHSVERVHLHLDRLYAAALPKFGGPGNLRVPEPLKASPPHA